MGREIAGHELHAVDAADPGFAESGLELQIDVQGKGLAQSCQRPASPVGQLSPALYGARIGEGAHMPLDPGAFTILRCEHVLGISYGLQPGHTPGFRCDACDAEGHRGLGRRDVGKLQLLAQHLKPVAHV